MVWNWEHEDWPEWQIDPSRLVGFETEFAVGNGVVYSIRQDVGDDRWRRLRVDLLESEGLRTSEIEGESLERESLRSSIRKQLGLQEDDRGPSKERGVAEMVVSIYETADEPLGRAELERWHATLFEGRTDLPDIGSYRSGPMEISSGFGDKRKIHFEAPPAERVQGEMDRFLTWFAETAPGQPQALPPLERAGMAHLWFESIHPFSDGNGRIGRAISEKALCQGFSRPNMTLLATQIERVWREYDRQLQLASRSLEGTSWAVWFARTALDAQRLTERWVRFLVDKSRVLSRVDLGEDQLKVLMRITRDGPDGFLGGLSSANYQEMTGVSPATATRDLRELVDAGVLVREGAGRGTRYFVSWLD